MERHDTPLRALVQHGDVAGALALAHRLTDAEPDPARQAAVAARLGGALLGVGLFEQARDALDEAAVTRGLSRGERASFAAWAALARLVCGDIAGADRQARRAEQAAARAGDPEALSTALCTLALAQQSRGRPYEAVAVAQRAIAVLGGQPPEGPRPPVPHLFLGLALVDCDRLDQADRAFTAGLDLCRAGHGRPAVPWFLSLRALCRYLGGEWDAGLRDAVEALADAEKSGVAAPRAVAWGVAALIESSRGNRRVGRALLQSAGAARPGLPAATVTDAEALALARASVGGRPDTGYAALRAGWRQAQLRGWVVTWRSLAPALVRAALEQGDTDVAAAVAQRARDGAALAGDTPSAMAAADRCDGLLAGDPEPLLAAAAAYDDAGRPAARAECLLETAQLWASLGERERVAPLVHQAGEIFRELRAAPWLARCSRLLSSTGAPAGSVPRQDRPPPGWASLTRSERAIAELAVDGLTNQQIAAALSLSPRTVQTHLSHIFVKLRISSRGELASRLGARAFD